MNSIINMEFCRHQAASLMPKRVFYFLFLLLAGKLHAQQFVVHGKVTNSRLEPLPLVSIQVKGNSSGTATKNDGTYRLLLPVGNHELVVTMIGYQTQIFPLVVKDDYEQNIILEEVSQSLGEVVIKAKLKDRAEEVIRNLIRNKENILAASGAYSSTLYIKAVQQDSGINIKKEKGRSKADAANEELTRMAMAEIALQLDYESDSRIKEQRLGVRKAGEPKNLFYLSATEGNFNFYQNLIKVPSISPTPFVSPVSYSGLIAYRFKTLKIQRLGKHKIYTISVKPRQVSNATVEGEITVSDSAWAILHTRFQFPAYHLQEYEFFEVAQDYEFVQNQAWMITRQEFTYGAKIAKGKLSGQTTVLFTDYKLNQQFGKRHFSTELSATNQEAYTKDSTFWQTVRKEPLSQKELRFIRYQDSVYRATHSDAYLDSMERAINKITWKKVGFFGQSLYNRKKERTWHLPPVISLYQPVAFGGSRINFSVSHSKTYPSRKNISVHTNLSYGIRNHDVNGSLSFSRMYNPFNRGSYSFSAGRDFQFIYEGDAWINMIKRNNIYLNNYAGAGHSLEIANGLFFFSDFEVAFRRSVSGYRTGSLVDSVLGDVLKDNQAVAFKSYNAAYGKLRLQYTPKQRYTREPREKIILGSRWPTFYVSWRKGIRGMLSSEVDFDYLEFGVEQQMNLGLIGLSKYSVRTGDFLNQKDLRLIDYQFQRRGDPFLFMNPHRSFQSLDSTFPVFRRFWEGHFVHEFNGLFLNKIPLLKKLQLREVGGGGFLVAQERNLRYAELFAGVERAFQSPFNPLDRFKIGIYVVGSAANQFKNPVQFKVGFTTWDKRKNRWF